MNFVQVLLLITFILHNCVFLVSSKQLVESNAEFCTIETNSGRVRGKINRTLFEMKPFYSFRGIPYAKPPIGDLRFKAPQKTDSWDGTLDAFDYGNDCVQTIGNIFFGSEDCLYLNIFVPTECSEMNSKKELWTMLYIYGGSFQIGRSKDYAPDFQMEADVILVVFNHRTGPFGYLNLNLPEYSGNMGMKDQLLALKWVSENIERFGGDKNKITLFGHSSGGMSTHLHMMHPESKRLFQRAIMLHGVALTNQLPTRKDHTDMIREFADSLENPVLNKSSSIVEFINEVDALQLCTKTCRQPLRNVVANRVWTVSVEGPGAINPFLTQFPIEILTNESFESNIDALFSSAYKEINAVEEQKHPELLQIFDKTFELDLPFERVQLDFTSEVYRNISKRVRDHYFDGKQVTLDGMHNLCSGILFLYGTDLSARIQVAKSKGRTFYSRFSVEDGWSLGMRLWKENNVTVVTGSHVIPLAYIFRFADQPKGSYENLQPNSFQRQLIKNISNFYANFAKFGNPLPNTEPLQFKTTQSDQFNYYEISNDGISTKTVPKQDRSSENIFWDGIYNDYKQHWNISFNFL